MQFWTASDLSGLFQFHMIPTACCAPALFNVYIVQDRTLKGPGNCVLKCKISGQNAKLLSLAMRMEHGVK